MNVLMLPGAIANHHLYRKPALPTSSINNSTSAYQINSLSSSFGNDIAHADVESHHSVASPSSVDDDDDFVVNAFRPFTNCNRQQITDRQNSSSTQFNRSKSNLPFRGKCNACGKLNHHAKDCEFLKKLTSCLDCMERKKHAPNHLRKCYRLSNNRAAYDSKLNIAKTLQSENFIPCENVDPDAFINVLDEDITCHAITSNDN